MEIQVLNESVRALTERVNQEFEKRSQQFGTVHEKLDSMGAEIHKNVVELAIIKEKVDRVHKTVHEDNGRPAMTTRIVQLEDSIKFHGESISSVRNWVDNEGRDLVSNSTIKLESMRSRWTFRGLVAVAIITLIGTLIVSLLNYIKD
jgi:hypothetical protein